jgi:hypothetical protein
MGDWATEGGHWYARDGSPRYETKAKNGNMRATTLRDARKELLVPSVTMIIKEAAAFGLEKWKRDQLLMAALTLPREPGEEESHWLERVYIDSQAQAKAAAERGTAIHGVIERAAGTPGVDDSDPLFEWAGAAWDEINARCGPSTEWSAERSFSHRLGYGGCIDLHRPNWLVDVKTKDGLEKVELYDEHLMQLAAYRRGAAIAKARAGILFVDRNEPKAVFLEATESQLNRGLWMFDALLLYWRWRTDYDSAWT